MQSGTFTLPIESAALFVYRWLPDRAPKAIVQIAHGLAEHAGRYTRLAKALTGAGYAVYANDHRGHGRTVKEPAALGFFAAHDGWAQCCEDLWHLNERIAADYPGVPIVFIGHSMGSFMAQQFIAEHGEALAGVVLSGSGGKPAPSIRIARMIARVERLRLGRRGASALLNNLSFGAFNKPFKPARTPFDWLTRDEAEVDKFISDPLSGFPISVQLSIDVMDAMSDLADASARARVPKWLPILVIAGTRDPVSRETKTIVELLAAYRAVGLTHVTHRFYPEARHELFNETNRDEVTRDVVAWVDSLIG